MLENKYSRKPYSLVLRAILALFVLVTCAEMSPAVYADEEEDEPVIEIIREDYSITIPTQAESQPEISVDKDSVFEEVEEEVIVINESHTEAPETEPVFIKEEVKEQETVKHVGSSEHKKKENKNVHMIRNNKKDYEAALNAGRMIGIIESTDALRSVLSLKDTKLMLISLRLLSFARRTAR